jgi:hypothetical protein
METVSRRMQLKGKKVPTGVLKGQALVRARAKK